VASLIINEIFVAVQSPIWPICTVLLEHIIMRIINQLELLEVAEKSKSSDFKRDSSYMTFLIELFGSIAVGFRRVLVVVDRDSKANNFQNIPFDSIKFTILQKINNLKPDWLNLLKHNVIDTVSIVKVKKSSKKSKIELLEQNNTRRFTIQQALQILKQISAISLEVMNDKISDIEFSIISPVTILEQIGNQEDLLK
jgi:hypothetical protein